MSTIFLFISNEDVNEESGERSNYRTSSGYRKEYTLSTSVLSFPYNAIFFQAVNQKLICFQSSFFLLCNRSCFCGLACKLGAVQTCSSKCLH